jgi:hypothetical protein
VRPRGTLAQRSPPPTGPDSTDLLRSSDGPDHAGSCAASLRPVTSSVSTQIHSVSQDRRGLFRLVAVLSCAESGRSMSGPVMPSRCLAAASGACQCHPGNLPARRGRSCS